MFTPKSHGRPPQSVIYSDAVISRWERLYKRRMPEYLVKKLYYRCKNDYNGRRWRNVI